jgi:hypothetical protein
MTPADLRMINVNGLCEQSLDLVEALSRVIPAKVKSIQVIAALRMLRNHGVDRFNLNLEDITVLEDAVDQVTLRSRQQEKA